MSHRGKLVQIPGDLVEFFWPQAEPFLRRAYEKVGYDQPTDFLERLMTAKCDLWFVYEGSDIRAAFITSVRGAEITIEAISGVGMSEWLDLLDELEALARAHGKTKMKVDCRPGFTEVLIPRGYRTERVVLRKEL